MSSVTVDVSKLDRKARLASFKWLLGHLSRNKFYFTVLILGNIIVNALAVLLPFLIGVMIDQALIPLDKAKIIYYVVLIAVVGLLRVIIESSTIVTNNKLGWQAMRDVRIEFFEKIQKKPINFHNRVRSGELMALATNDLQQLGGMINPGIRLVSQAFVSIVFVIWLSFLTQSQMAFALIPFFILYMIGIRQFNRSMNPISRVFNNKWAEISTSAQDSITGVRVVRAFNGEEFEAKQFRAVVEEFKDIWDIRQMITAKYWPLFALYAAIGFSFFGGTYLVLQGTLTVGELVSINGMLLTLIGPTFIISFVITMIQGGLAGGERIFHTMELVDPEDQYESTKLDWDPTFQGKIEFKNVSFKYPGTEKYVLKNVNLTIEPGETVALVGPTGTGKSTLTKLLLRFYDYEGTISIDGVDITKIKLNELRQNMGRVEQDVFLFASSIKENLVFGLSLDHKVTDEAIEQAARIAQAHEFIMEQPEGYNTNVGERGNRLSGGQKQRIAIARALLVDPKILILDDSTSAIDSETEEKIASAIDVVIRQRTTILITHRLYAIRKADKIVVLKNGEITAVGKHEELLRTSFDYRRIFKRHIELPEVVNKMEA